MTDHEQFVTRFGDIWATVEPERFAELYTDGGWLLHPGMTQPLPASEVVSYMRGVKAAAPDIGLVVADWASRGNVLYIDWTMHASLQGRQVSWIGADKCVLRGDRAISITAFFDAHPLWLAVDPGMGRDSTLEQAARDRVGSNR
jgi:hypothetical protein